MISFEAAQTILTKHPFPLIPEEVHFTQSKGRTLAEEIRNERPAPPFNRVSMDGISFDYKDLNQLKTEGLPIFSTAFAGQAQVSHQTGSCAKVMTGAVLPEGSNTVVRIEDLRIENNSAFLLPNIEIELGKNIHRKGSDCDINALLLSPGKTLNSADLAVLATLGKTEVTVYKVPKVGIVSTGDELVEVNQTPADHQIRKSNPYFLRALCEHHGLSHRHVHLPDHKESMMEELRVLAEECDVLLISGGVSMGERDYVAESLMNLGVNIHFHKVAQRPGKPLLFGSRKDLFVFGLPGNPISVTATASVHFLTWLKISKLLSDHQLEAVLSADIQFDRPLTYLLPVSMRMIAGVMNAVPVKINGSGDVLSLSKIDGFLQLDADQAHFEKGNVYPYYPCT